MKIWLDIEKLRFLFFSFSSSPYSLFQSILAIVACTAHSYSLCSSLLSLNVHKADIDKLRSHKGFLLNCYIVVSANPRSTHKTFMMDFFLLSLVLLALTVAVIAKHETRASTRWFCPHRHRHYCCFSRFSIKLFVPFYVCQQSDMQATASSHPDTYGSHVLPQNRKRQYEKYKRLISVQIINLNNDEQILYILEQMHSYFGNIFSLLKYSYM